MSITLRSIIASGAVTGVAVVSFGLAGPAMAATGSSSNAAPNDAVLTSSGSGPPTSAEAGAPTSLGNGAPGPSDNGAPGSPNGGPPSAPIPPGHLQPPRGVHPKGPAPADPSSPNKPGSADPKGPTGPITVGTLKVTVSFASGRHVVIRVEGDSSHPVKTASASSSAFVSPVLLHAEDDPGATGTATLKENLAPGVYRVRVRSGMGEEGIGSFQWWTNRGGSSKNDSGKNSGGENSGSDSGSTSGTDGTSSGSTGSGGGGGKGSHPGRRSGDSGGGSGGSNESSGPSNAGSGGTDSGADNGGQTSETPKGGAQTGGGGAAASPINLPLVAGGGMIALVGAGASVIAIRRHRRSTSRDHTPYRY